MLNRARVERRTDGCYSGCKSAVFGLFSTASISCSRKTQGFSGVSAGAQLRLLRMAGPAPMRLGLRQRSSAPLRTLNASLAARVHPSPLALIDKYMYSCVKICLSNADSTMLSLVFHSETLWRPCRSPTSLSTPLSAQPTEGRRQTASRTAAAATINYAAIIAAAQTANSLQHSHRHTRTSRHACAHTDSPPPASD